VNPLHVPLPLANAAGCARRGAADDGWGVDNVRNPVPAKIAFAPAMSYCVTAEFSELPADDIALESWLRVYPGMQVIGVNRNGKIIEVTWGTSGSVAESLGERPLFDLRAKLDPLGYKGVKRYEPH
jgi:hypothetical protein